MRLSPSSAGLLAAFALAVPGCRDHLILPPESMPATLEPVSGDGQQGRIGQQLPNPLVVQVLDASGRPVAGAPIVFEFVSAVPNADILPDTVPTNASGQASARIVLGTNPGTQVVEAFLPGSANLRAEFNLTAVRRGGGGRGGGGGDDDDD